MVTYNVGCNIMLSELYCISTMLCYVDINHVLSSLLQDILLLKSAKQGDLKGVRESLTKQANINFANEVYTMLMYL